MYIVVLSTGGEECGFCLLVELGCICLPDVGFCQWTLSDVVECRGSPRVVNFNLPPLKERHHQSWRGGAPLCAG